MLKIGPLIIGLMISTQIVAKPAFHNYLQEANDITLNSSPTLSQEIFQPVTISRKENRGLTHAQLQELVSLHVNKNIQVGIDQIKAGRLDPHIVEMASHESPLLSHPGQHIAHGYGIKVKLKL